MPKFESPGLTFLHMYFQSPITSLKYLLPQTLCGQHRPGVLAFPQISSDFQLLLIPSGGPSLFQSSKPAVLWLSFCFSDPDIMSFGNSCHLFLLSVLFMMLQALSSHLSVMTVVPRSFSLSLLNFFISQWWLRSLYNTLCSCSISPVPRSQWLSTFSHLMTYVS